jgi:hypothetical protein
MLTLIFLVCSPITGECYSSTSTIIYPTEEACQQDAMVIIDRVSKQQKEDNLPPERAIYKCISWGTPT